MNFRKLAVLAAVVAAASMAFAATAAATTLTSPSGTIYTGTIRLESEGQVVFKGTGITDVKCTGSTAEFKVEQHGSGVTASGNLSKWNFISCTSGLTQKTLGAAEIHASGGSNGTWTSSGWEFALHTAVGECVYRTANTDLGTLTGGTPATLDVSAVIPRSGGPLFCPSSVTWTVNYKITQPSTLLVDA